MSQPEPLFLIMQPQQPLTIRGSKLQAGINFALGLAFSGMGIYMSLEKNVAGAKDLGHGFTLSAFGFVVLFLAAKTFGTTLTYDNGTLVLTRLFVQKSFQLTALVSAKKYLFPIGKYPDKILKLTDVNGNTMRLDLTDFSFGDLGQMADVLRPFLFAPQVERNFDIFAYRVIKTPRLSARGYAHSSFKMLGKTILFVLLPCLVIMALVMVWAIVTKQPVFR